MHIYLIEKNLRPRPSILTAYGEYYEQSDICAFRAGIRGIKSGQAAWDLWLQLAVRRLQLAGLSSFSDASSFGSVAGRT